MARILVVDDGKVDQLRAGKLLENRIDVDVVYANNGVEALDWIERELPDVVLTDMHMPEMDGLELTGEIRQSHPSVPVVLMTAHGSEEMAAEALRLGAASYVPKKHLTRDLTDIVVRLLAQKKSDRERQYVIEHISRAETEFILDNNRSHIQPLITYIKHDLERVGLCDLNNELRVGVALDEAISNAMLHGNLDLNRKALDQDDDPEKFMDLVNDRATQPPWRDRRVTVVLRFDQDEATFVIRDEGDGFDVSNLPDPTDPTHLAGSQGRGLLLINSFMDEVHHNEAGNEVTLVMRKDTWL